jgi:hypothetical protein
MKLNTLTEKQRIILCRAMHFYQKERMTKTEKEDVEYLRLQLKNGKGTQ